MSSYGNGHQGQGQGQGASGGQGQAGYGQANQGYGYPGQAPGYGYGYGMGQPAGSTGLVSSSTERFIKGVLIGAAAAYVLTNPRVQNAVIKGSVRAWDFMQGGIEEVKERFRDAEAEIQAEKTGAE